MRCIKLLASFCVRGLSTPKSVKGLGSIVVDPLLRAAFFCSRCEAWEKVRRFLVGLDGLIGEPDGSPCKVGVAATDIATGLYAHGAIMAALISRQQTGRGLWIDCNLFETQVSESSGTDYTLLLSLCVRVFNRVADRSQG